MRRILAIAVLAGLTAAAPQDYHLRVTVDLVQVDASVTDSHGNPVPDLRASDFRVLLDGKPQPLKNCTFVPMEEAPTQRAGIAPIPAVNDAQPQAPEESIKSASVRRSIVLFVADLLTSAESMPGIRAGLKKFVREQLHPGDLVAVVRSSAGLGALQDFTPDPTRLLAAIERVRWTPHAVGIGGASAYEPIGLPSLRGMGPLDMAQADKIDSVERATLATTTSLMNVVRGMADLPGRKSVILLSDGLRLASPDEMDPSGDTANGSGAFIGPVYGSMRRVVDESVRAGVVVYSIDTRGLSSLRAGASDHLKQPGAPGGDWVSQVTAGRRAEYTDNQWGSMFVASQTGGFMVTEANRIDAALARIVADQRGYYLLAFQPPEGAMHPGAKGGPDFHRLKIEVLRPGLTVRSHGGFFGVGDTERPASSPELRLSRSLDSPFQTSEIGMEVETSYLTAKRDTFIRATLFIDGKDLTFSGPPIHRTGVLHMILRAFDANGAAVPGGIDQTLRIDLNEEGYERAQKWGLIYTTLLPVKKPGPYRIRAACRDEVTGHIGNGGEFVSIPLTRGDSLRLSGIVFQHALGPDDHLVPASGPNSYSAGQSARFAVQITGRAQKSGAERLEMHARLFRDGAEVWHSAAMAVERNGKDTSSAFARGVIEVPPGLEAGRYVVRLDVSPEGQGEEVKAWQWATLTLQ